MLRAKIATNYECRIECAPRAAEKIIGSRPDPTSTPCSLKPMLPPVPVKVIHVRAQRGDGGQKQRSSGQRAEGEPISGKFLGEDGGGFHEHAKIVGDAKSLTSPLPDQGPWRSNAPTCPSPKHWNS